MKMLIVLGIMAIVFHELCDLYTARNAGGATAFARDA